jgi:DNA-binding NtrC family response regulator
MKNIRILVAEDHDLSRENLVERLKGYGYEVKGVKNGREAMGTFIEEKYDLVITDQKMPDVDGLQLLKYIKEVSPESVVILITAYGTVHTAVEAMRMGAYDYITKPLKDYELVRFAIERALSTAKLKEENVILKKQLKDKYDFGKMVGYSDSMRDVFKTIEKVAATDSTVVIYGESGTGKELVARAIHFNSDRNNYPLIPVNCGAIPEELLESELFGHEKGAFTGAIRSRIGRFELAQGGTIFLDEIGDMSPALQVKVLRVIQERQFERIGGVKTINVDVRIVTATNQNLEKAVEEKRFREDLFYRINVIPIFIPPLRERRMDIPVLITHFLKKFNKSKKKNVKNLTSEAMNHMMKYPWPGNVRELENTMEMLVVMKEDGSIDINDLPNKILSVGRKHPGLNGCEIDIPETGIAFNDMVEQYEKDLLLRALEKTGGIKNRAAKILNLNRTTFVEKLKRFNLG